MLVLLCLTIGALNLQNGHDLFQKALAKERAEGNLEEAIALYQKVIEESKDKALAAKAQLRIGYCYEKLGLQEANKAFQLVIDNYPGQEQAVKEAREKLAILLRAQAVIKEEDKGITIRKLWSGRVGSSWGSPSPDGKYFAFYFDPQADLAIKEFATGKVRRLYLKKPNQRGFGAAGQFCWSPDGKQIAYGWASRESNTQEVSIVNFDGSNPRTIYQSKDWVAPYAWSPDGKYLLIYFMKRPKGKYQIGLLKVDDGSMREYDFPVDPSTASSFSPDSRYVALTVPQKDDSENNDVSLFSLAEEKEIALIKHPAGDSVVGWAPDGHWVFFGSDRSGNRDLWAIRVSEGSAQGDPILIQRGMGDAYNVWMIPTGALFYSITVSTKDVYVAKIDFDKNKILEGPKKATQHYTDTNSVPAWSADGEYLAFVSNRKDDPKKALCILSNKTGEIREFFLDLLSWMNPTWIHWAPDGQSIIHTGFDRPYSCGFWRTDLNTGKMSMALRFDPIKQIWGSCISKDGKTIYDIKMDKKIQKSQLVAQNLETQKVDELYVSEWIHALALSPDEQWFAFAEGEQPSNMKLNTLPIKGGKPQTLHTFGKGEWPCAIAWTPDGRNLLFSKEKVDESKKSVESLWTISVDGGEPKELGLNTNSISHLRIHPDGQHIAFHSGNRAEEIWVMDNFLPKK